MSNTPLNADDELAVRNILYRQAGQSQIPEKYVDEYIERVNKAMWEFILVDRKKHELQAEIASNEAWYALGRMIDPREFVAEIGRLEFKKQELEKL